MLHLCSQDPDLIFEAETNKSLFQTDIYLTVAKVLGFFFFFYDEGELTAGDSLEGRIIFCSVSGSCILLVPKQNAHLYNTETAAVIQGTFENHMHFNARMNKMLACFQND